MPPNKPLSSTEFKQIYSTVPRLCVDVLIENDQGVLMTLRTIEPKNIWHIPGGTLLLNESLEQAARRIARTELGVEVKVIKQLGAIDFFPNNGLGHPVTIVHKVEIISGEIKLNSEASDFKFFKTLPPNLLPQHKKFLEDYFKQK